MNQISACIFPDTRPDATLILPFVQVFHQVVYCQPVEADSSSQETFPPVIEQWLDAGLLLLHAPAPLGEDRDRFQALLSDIQNRRDNYTGQLAALTLAGSQRGPYGESRHSIISQLLKSGSISTVESEEQTMLLWQARLLLKLGEFFDSEQDALDAALQQLINRENALLSELRMESDNPFSLSGFLQGSGGDGNRQLEHRLTSWSRIFCLGDTADLGPMAFITQHIDGFERILDVSERDDKCRTMGAFSIPLPVAAGSAGQPDSSLDRAAEAPFLKLLSAIAEEKNTNKALDEWQQFCNTLTTKPGYTHRTLRLVAIIGRSPAELFNDCFASLSPTLLKQGQLNGDAVLIGLLEPA